MKKVIFAFVLGISLLAISSYAQPRPMEKQPDIKPTPTPAPPQSFPAKYEGGMAGYSKEQGTLKFDDENERLVFFGKEGKELFGIPYASMLVIYPQSQSVQTTAGKVVSVVPYVGLLGGFIKEKRRYLVVHFDDPDIENAKGLTNFKLESKEILDSVIFALAGKANLKQRGDAYYRPSKKKPEEESN